jgi:hypothetical protein
MDSCPFVGLPALMSYLMIQGAPYFKDSAGKVCHPPAEFEAKLLSALFHNLVKLSGPLHIVCDSQLDLRGLLQYPQQPNWLSCLSAHQAQAHVWQHHLSYQIDKGYCWSTPLHAMPL